MNYTGVDFIKDELLRYEAVFAKQAGFLRADPCSFQAAMVKIQQSPLVAKDGQCWEPTENNIDDYLAHCNEICQLVPQGFDDRVKILHGAYAGFTSLATCKIAKQLPESVQLAISNRHDELLLSAYSGPTPLTNDRQSPLESKLAVEPRRITPEELRLFQNPDKLHGKQFIISPDTDDSGMYEVIGYCKRKDKPVQYDVLFEDCAGDPIRVDAGEMMSMLEDSLYLPA